METAFISLVAAQFVYHWWTVRSLNQFWAKQVEGLTEKLMSRDIVEYKQATQPPVPKIQVDDHVPLEDYGSLPNFTL